MSAHFGGHPSTLKTPALRSSFRVERRFDKANPQDAEDINEMRRGRFPKNTTLVFRIRCEPSPKDQLERDPTDEAQSSKHGVEEMTDPDEEDASR